MIPKPKKSTFQEILGDFSDQALTASLIEFMDQAERLKAGETLLVGSEPQFQVAGSAALAHAERGIAALQLELSKRRKE